MDLFELLTAINRREYNEQPSFFTTAAISARLGVSASETEKALRQAEQDGWAVEEQDESVNVGPDFDRQLWHLSDAGREELYRLQDAYGPD